MKKIYTLIIFLAFTMLVYSQQVSRNWVLVEIATGTWCYYCPGAAMGADDLIANGDPAAIIENHNGDPFATSDSDARNAYYTVSGYPTANFDGSYDEVVGGSNTNSMYSSYEPIVSSRIGVDSDFTLEIYGTNVGDDYTITIRLQDVGGYSSYDDLKLRFALTESEIPYTWQGMDEVNFVNRLMAPDATGTNLSTFDLTEVTMIELDFTFDNTWDDQHCELVAFIQDDGNKEVLQSQKVAINDLVALLQANFEASTTLTCSGSSVDFTDLSEGADILSWEWSFEGGTPATSTDENPTVTYNAPGIYDVELTIYDADGSDTFSMNDYISILETPAKADAPSGDSQACNGQPISYTVADVPYAQDYEWELDPAEAGSLNAEGTSATFNPTEDWTGDFTIRARATNICGDGEWSDDMEGNLLDSPNLFTLEGGGGYCLDGDGSEIILDGSETGISYELYLDDEATGTILEGTGSALSFGLQTDEGYFTTIAFNDDCSTSMMNQVEVYLLFAPDTPAMPEGDNAVCNDTEYVYTTTGTDDADDYVWFVDPVEAATLNANGMEVGIEWNPDYSGMAYLSVSGVNDCGEGNYSEELQIDVDDIPEPVIQGADLVCDEDIENYMVAETEGNEYNWEVIGGTITEGLGTYAITVEWGEAGTGIISVEEITPNDCFGNAADFEVTIDECTGIIESENISDVAIYPNPATDQLNVEFETKNGTKGELRILNQIGQTVWQNTVESTSNKFVYPIDISELNSGMYIINFQTTAGETVIQQFVKE